MCPNDFPPLCSGQASPWLAVLGRGEVPKRPGPWMYLAASPWILGAGQGDTSGLEMGRAVDSLGPPPFIGTDWGIGGCKGWQR